MCLDDRPVLRFRFSEEIERERIEHRYSVIVGERNGWFFVGHKAPPGKWTLVGCGSTPWYRRAAVRQLRKAKRQSSAITRKLAESAPTSVVNR